MVCSGGGSLALGSGIAVDQEVASQGLQSAKYLARPQVRRRRGTPPLSPGQRGGAAGGAATEPLSAIALAGSDEEPVVIVDGRARRRSGIAVEAPPGQSGGCQASCSADVCKHRRYQPAARSVSGPAKPSVLGNGGRRGNIVQQALVGKRQREPRNKSLRTEHTVIITVRQDMV